MTALLPSFIANQEMIWGSLIHSNEFLNDGNCCARSIESFWKEKTQPGGCTPRQEQRSPLRNWPCNLTLYLRLYRSPPLRVYQQRNVHDHCSWLRIMYTESIPCTNNFWLHGVFYRECASRVQWLHRLQPILNSVAKPIVEDAEMLDLDEWHGTIQLMYMTYGYSPC
jgi:hypothetical protein